MQQMGAQGIVGFPTEQGRLIAFVPNVDRTAEAGAQIHGAADGGVGCDGYGRSIPVCDVLSEVRSGQALDQVQQVVIEGRVHSSTRQGEPHAGRGCIGADFEVVPEVGSIGEEGDHGRQPVAWDFKTPCPAGT